MQKRHSVLTPLHMTEMAPLVQAPTVNQESDSIHTSFTSLREHVMKRNREMYINRMRLKLIHRAQMHTAPYPTYGKYRDFFWAAVLVVYILVCLYGMLTISTVSMDQYIKPDYRGVAPWWLAAWLPVAFFSVIVLLLYAMDCKLQGFIPLPTRHMLNHTSYLEWDKTTMQLSLLLWIPVAILAAFVKMAIFPTSAGFSYFLLPSCIGMWTVTVAISALLINKMSSELQYLKRNIILQVSILTMYIACVVSLILTCLLTDNFIGGYYSFYFIGFYIALLLLPLVNALLLLQYRRSMLMFMFVSVPWIGTLILIALRADRFANIAYVIGVLPVVVPCLCLGALYAAYFFWFMRVH